jgi:hypothetical protein
LQVCTNLALLLKQEKIKASAAELALAAKPANRLNLNYGFNCLILFA